MQQLIRSIPLRRRRAGPLDEPAARRRDLRWGITTLITVAVLAIAIGVVSVVHIGMATYSAYLSDAAALRVGDEVRIAGITVGEVKAIDLESDRVALQFTVRQGVFVGDQSTLSVRMLTIVGGHYVAVLPAGAKPLGKTPIPADRVVLPYSLPQLFQDAVRPAEQIDAETLRRNFAAVTTAAAGSPEGLRRVIDAVGSIVDLLDKQNAEISRSLGVADEYVTAIAANRSAIGQLVARLRILETVIADNKAAVGESLRNVAVLVGQLAPAARLWESDLKPSAQALIDTIPALDQLGEKLGTLLDSVRGFGERLQGLLTPQGLTVDQSASTITAPALCVPVPGKGC
ncbi:MULTISPECIES: MlaD family protein [unclassified Nocardia]|uniref:MlaD family protein n=1 Tax=unclassified Nocardia TaxID=2637762 RepID=UPI0035DB9167